MTAVEKPSGYFPEGLTRTLGEYPLEAEGPVDAIRVPQVNLGILILIEGKRALRYPTYREAIKWEREGRGKCALLCHSRHPLEA